MPLDISLRDIAEAAGVSRTTVSLALRGHPRISEATRERIQQLAREMGYRPHADVSRVLGEVRAKGKEFDRPVLALISDYEHPLHQRKNPSDTWKGFKQRCEELGYQPEEFQVGPHGLSAKRLTQVLTARGIRGVVFTGLLDTEAASEMDLESFACAAIGNSIQTPCMHRATSDKFYNTQLCCEELWARGARRIGLAIPSFQEHRVEHTFLSGYLVFHRLHQHAGWKNALVKDDNWDPDAIASWIQKQKLDGCVVAYSGVAEKQSQVQIAEVNVMEPGRMGVNQCHDRIAAGAVDLVDAQLRRNLFGPPPFQKDMLVKGQWVNERDPNTIPQPSDPK